MRRETVVKYALIALSGLLAFLLLSKLSRRATDSELNNAMVILTAKVPKDDVFQFFYWEKSDQKFQIKKSIRTEVKGSDTFQEIAFRLPVTVNIFRLRLDIGENKEQGAVEIKGLKFIADNKEIDLGVEQFNSLFSPNQYVKTESERLFTGFLGTSKEKTFYDPYFVSVDGSKEMQDIATERLTNYPYLISALICILFILFLLYNLEKVTISSKGVFVILFMVILVLPTLQSKMGLVKSLDNLEKRQLAEKPGFSWSKDFVEDFETYYDDNFGFRNRLVDWGAGIKTKIFRSSKKPELVMFGKDKWLFYNRMVGNSRMYKSYTRSNLLPPDTLKLLINGWKNRKAKYEAEGRKYFLVFWPNKHSIYPEFMSSIMTKQIKDTISRVDQIVDYINKNNASVTLNDVRPRLAEAKEDYQVYYKFDSHWNDYGAFLGYQDFFWQNLDVLGIEPKSESDFEIKWTDYYGGELIQLLGVRNSGFFKDQRPRFGLKKNKNQIQHLPTEGFPKLTVRTKNEFAGNKLKALIFRDSFTNSLEQFFSLHFYEVTYIWSEHKEYYVRKLQPDVIIDSYVEREIGNKVD